MADLAELFDQYPRASVHFLRCANAVNAAVVQLRGALLPVACLCPPLGADRTAVFPCCG